MFLRHALNPTHSIRHVRASTLATSLGLRVPAYTNDLVRGARVRSTWVTFELSSALCSGQPHRQGALHWNRTSSLTNTPTSRKNMASTTKE